MEQPKRLLDDHVSERTIGQSNYTTPSAFEDYLFGLTLMTGQNQVSIIWDMVNLTITAENTRTSVGSVAVLEVNGTYSFDSTVWNGTVVFNDTLTKDECWQIFLFCRFDFGPSLWFDRFQIRIP